MMEIDAYKTSIFTNIGMDCLHKPVATTKQNPELTAVTSTPPHNGYSYTQDS